MTAVSGIAAAMRDVLAASALGPIWVTRDSDPITAALDDECDVWSSAPVRHLVCLASTGAPSVMWVTGEFDISGRIARVPVAAARAMFPCVPDDDRQCVRIG